MSFETLGLRAELLSAIAAQGYTNPTPIQTGAIPAIFEGCDLLAGAQTGTGKTAAFALPIVQMLGENIPPDKRRRPRALVLVPTRELAAQVSEQMNNYARRLSLRSTMIYGGVNIQAQIERLHRGVDIVVATPGRLLDHAERGTVNLSRIKFLVLDEADRMLDLGFIDAIHKVAQYLPVKRQTLLFSATYSQSIKQLADELLNQPRRIEVARRNIAADAVTQAVYQIERSRKREMLSFLIRTGRWNQVLVFARTRYGADKLTEELLLDGIKASAIHSNKSQSLRTRTLAEFKRGEFRVLVATDVAARGLDIERLPHVVNYDLPQVPEDYVHRIGRTGRAGEDGVALSLVSREEQPLLQAIEKLLKYAIPRQTLAEFPQYAAKRSIEVKESKQAKEKSKARKTREKLTQAPEKTRTSRRKKVVEERPAPKTGRRGARS
ncbi:DEAD/DEAH box helicase [Pelobacter propionicus]|uniref:DEAD-box ATP-dependent RNA helicase RhpA n=1 Tax=Pelobacter propionicus (strain DSM 2379 / NBRC 103807 / OttBd1) TaxID=338966 RepID=A1AS19_PELPD|nr:DEAD/DEAH box helicase [Pelobacter propionicus]ABL00140.1 DEAD/DEAH box helicase domain protein [Pelobacter propionicus DSM 2379]